MRLTRFENMGSSKAHGWLQKGFQDAILSIQADTTRSHDQAEDEWTIEKKTRN
jgi:hypothetical protein